MMEDPFDVDVGEGEQLPAPQSSGPPPVLIVFPLQGTVPFPGLILPVLARAGAEEDILERAIAQGRHIGLLFSEDSGPPWKKSSFVQTGVVAELHKRIRLPDGNSHYICRGLRRFQVQRWARLKENPVAKVVYPDEILVAGDEVGALERNVLTLTQKVASHNPGLGDGFSLAAANVGSPGALADFAAAYLLKETEAKQALLDDLDVAHRLREVDIALTRELVMLELGDRIQNEIREKIEEQQKQFFLREQIKIIRRELGEEQEPAERDRDFFLGKLETGAFPEEVADRIREEVERLSSVPSMSPEYPVVRNYLEWLVELPWELTSKDRLDLGHAEAVLDREHWGLKEAKERVLEFLGVRKLKPEKAGAILCFCGPPGVGKTSLAMAIAEAMGRKLERMSLGGMRDEAEIKGHRRTYVGAMPGRIMRMMRRAGTCNPVIVLDEVDKIGMDFRGDPASALLEVLDPTQNHSFMDHYLDLPFDLSKVLFIATANVIASVPPALRDRMEVIDLPGYITEEKLQIARRHLVPQQLEAHGLDATGLKLPVPTLRRLIRHWTREAGVRGLEKSIAAICRKRTLALARRRRPKPTLAPKDLERFLGPPKYSEDRIRLRPQAGVALGLAYTQWGGEVLEIECASFPGSGKVVFTGSLGEVMTESCRIAHTQLRVEGADWGLAKDSMAELDLHIHFPAGAVPKDGPSAGAAIACAMLSHLTGKQTRARLAMTGEITLTGEILPVGGIREKVLAAKRSGIRTVLLPEANMRDLTELDSSWTRGLKFVPVAHFRDVVRAAFSNSFRLAR